MGLSSPTASTQCRIIGWFTGSAPRSGSPTSWPSNSFSRARSAALSVSAAPVVVAMRPLPRPSGHTQPGAGDDLALHLVDPAAERVDLGRPAGPLDVAVQHR